MKNLHILKTKKPSRLRYYNNSEYILSKGNLLWADSKNIYITSDEEIKEGDWVIAIEGIWKNTITKITGTPITDVWRKIILTTDQDLIKDGVQPIDDEFLEWFVKNPSCEWVEAKLIEEIPSGFTFGMFGNDEPPTELVYKIIIPKEESKEFTTEMLVDLKQGLDNAIQKSNPLFPNYKHLNKQETLEEANWKVLGTKKDTFYNGAKWQAERMYSEEEVFNLLCKMPNYFKMIIAQQPEAIKDWFEQFKKK